jgi:hypothetical protein
MSTALNPEVEQLAAPGTVPSAKAGLEDYNANDSADSVQDEAGREG